MPLSLTFRPNDIRWYQVDFGDPNLGIAELLAGETISTVSVTGSPTGLTIGACSIIANTVRCRVSGGSPGDYALTVSVGTSGGATYEEVIPFNCLGE